MATFKQQGLVSRSAGRLISGMVHRGHTEEYATRIFKQIEGFGSYSFPESHAGAFALLIYISAWIKCHYPAVFVAAILNSLPMGFYQPAQLIADARPHGVRFLPSMLAFHTGTTRSKSTRISSAPEPASGPSEASGNRIWRAWLPAGLFPTGRLRRCRTPDFRRLY
jgi:DNA polymerase III alpha subunit